MLSERVKALEDRLAKLTTEVNTLTIECGFLRGMYSSIMERIWPGKQRSDPNRLPKLRG